MHWYAWPIGLLEAWAAYCLTWRLPHGLGVLPTWISLPGSACRQDRANCRTFPGAGYCTTHRSRQPAKPAGLSMLDGYDAPPRYDTANLLFDGPSTYLQTAVNTIHTHLSGVVASGVATPSEVRDLGWWFTTCPQCGASLICTPEYPEPECRCLEEAHDMAVRKWVNMNLVPPPVVGYEFGPVFRCTPDTNGPSAT